MIDQPHKDVDKTCIFLGRTPHESLGKIIGKETRNANYLLQREDELNYIEKGDQYVRILDDLLEPGNVYEGHIND